jgi:hypothetical protein
MARDVIRIFKRVRPLRLALAGFWVLAAIGACLWQGAVAAAVSAPAATLLPGQMWQYQITGKAYVKSECYTYQIVPSSPLGENLNVKVEFTGIGATKTLIITPEQNAGQPVFTTCVDTVDGGSAYDFNIANLSTVGSPRVLVYGDSLGQSPYIATSLGATDCKNVSGEVGQYTLSQAAAFANDYQRGVGDTLNSLIQCGPATGGFITSYTLQVTGTRSIKTSQYSYIDGSPQRYYSAQPTCHLTIIDPGSAAITCAAIPAAGIPFQEFNVFY